MFDSNGSLMKRFDFLKDEAGSPMRFDSLWKHVHVEVRLEVPLKTISIAAGRKLDLGFRSLVDKWADCVEKHSEVPWLKVGVR